MHWNEIEAQIILMRYGCDYCPAKAGEWCMTKSGNKASFLHANRGQEVREFTWAVYEEGEKAGKFFAERRAQREIDKFREDNAKLAGKVRQLEQFQMAWTGGQ